MRHWDPLNDKQLALLREIAGHPEAPLAAGANVVGLLDRRLVFVRRKDGRRVAEITKAGRHYLDNGAHPDDPSLKRTKDHTSARAAANATSGSTLPPLPPTEAPAVSWEQVLEQVLANSDYSVRVHPKSDAERRSWLRAVGQIKKERLSPAGFHIRYANEGAWGIRLWLEPGDDPHEVRRAQRRDPVAVPERVHRLHPAVAPLREAGRLLVSKAVLQRALRLLHAVAVEGERRGYEVRPIQGKESALSLRVTGLVYPVSISEEKDRVAHVLTAYERKEMARGSWFRPPEWDYEPSGRLVLALPSTGRSNRYRWTDRERWRLDQKLPDLFAEIEARAITDQQRKQEAEREAAVLRAEWEEVRRRATARLEEAHRAEWLNTQMERWRQAADIRAYVAELHANRKLTEAEEARLSWAADYANRLILASKSVAPPPLPQLDAKALQPYMEGWSAYEPRPPHRVTF